MREYRHPPWTEHAACRGRDPETWFPEDRKTPEEEQNATHEAKRICIQCPVRRECLAFAFEDEHSIKHGVWGGTTPQQRRRVRSDPKRIEILMEDLEFEVWLRPVAMPA